MQADRSVVASWVGGEMRVLSGGGESPVFNPALGKEVRRVAHASAAEAQEAVRLAHEAWPAWRDTSPLRRARVMFAFRAWLEENRGRLAAAITEEHGKTLEDAAGEVQRGLEVVEYACGIPEVLKGELTAQIGGGIDAFSQRQPLGVCLGITPFNFPVMVPLWMIPMAIACGNTFILKPSEKDPSASLLLAEGLQAAGLPAGVFSVVQGGQTAVEALIDDERVQAVSFVGSTPVARAVQHRATAGHKRVQALGGAKNHLVVMPDANLDAALDGIIGAAYGSAGERCMAISVVVAVGDVADTLVERLRARAMSVRVGAGTEEGVEMGPLVTREHLQKVLSYVEAGLAEGAELLVDGRASPVAGEGYFMAPCLFDRVTPEMKIYQEEIFGPVLSVVRVRSLQEAIQLINRHPFANGVSLFTNDGLAARTFSQGIEVGMVGINVPIPVPVAFHSFGGWRQSLFGDHHMHGPEGVRFFTRYKAVAQRWPGLSAEQSSQFSMPIMG